MLLPGLLFVLATGLTVRLPFLLAPEMLAMFIPLMIPALRLAGTRPVAAIMTGVLLTTIELQTEVGLRLKSSFEGQLTGRICSMPVSREADVQFTFCPTETSHQDRRYRVSWRMPVLSPKPHEVWRLPLRLTEPTGSVNFFVFDYERWLFAKRIHGRGYVTRASEPERVSKGGGSIDGVRLEIREQLTARVPQASLGALLALALGDTSYLTPQQWQLLSATGTTHLLVVSGLHTGLIAGISLSLLRWLGVSLRMTVGFAIVITTGYALLAGWGLPVQRALIMICTALTCVLLARRVQPWTQFLAALVLVSLFDSMASLSQGFWMSFGAVAVLLFGLNDRTVATMRPWHKAVAALQAQWIVYLGMMPVLAALLGQLPLGAILVNLIAIPWVGLVLVPLVFLGTILQFVIETPAQLLLHVAAWQISELWRCLTLMSSIVTALPVAALDSTRLVLAVLGAVVLLLPAGLVARWPALLVLLLLLRQTAGPAERPDLRLSFLDVGQGLSVVIETRDAVHVYDTGPMVPNRFSAADQFLLPTLAARGWRQISVLLISHFDNDHAGGRAQVLAAMPVHQTLEPGRCNHRWISAGVKFAAFQALPSEAGRNDGSCLLLIQAGQRVILLTGDIETRGELALLERALPRPDVMSSPHHGSHSSSSPALLNRLRPDTIIVSAGYNNRFGHPSHHIVKRYQRRAIRTLNTADTGGIVLTVTNDFIGYHMARPELPAVWRRQAKP